MGIFDLFESDSEKAEREHNEGQEAGSKASITAQIAHDAFDHLTQTDAYNEGWDNGVANQGKN